MQNAIIDGTDISVSRISFGTASLHHLLSSKQRQYLLDCVASEGISHFDSSPYYGNGLAESELGILMSGRRNQFTITTKIGLYPYGGTARGLLDVWGRKIIGKVYPKVSRPVTDWAIQRAARSLDESLKRLKTDYVDFLFLFFFNIELIDGESFLRWLESEKAKGKIRCWGLAGLPSLIEPWLSFDSPLTTVLQLKDSLENNEANNISAYGRAFQFTYGYLSSAMRHESNDSLDSLIKMSLIRNRSGSILVSTRKANRVKSLTRLAG